MVSREIMRNFKAGLERLLAAEAALEQTGRTIYDLSIAERSQIHPLYQNRDNLDHACRRLVELGQLPSKQEATLQDLVAQTITLKKVLDEESIDLFSLTQLQLANFLGLDHSSLACYIGDLTLRLKTKYHRTPAFAESQYKTYANNKERVRAEYARLVGMCPQLKPTMQEIADNLDMPRTTVAGWCANLGLETNTSRHYSASTLHLWRSILQLEGQLAREHSHVTLLPQKELASHFPDKQPNTIHSHMLAMIRDSFLMDYKTAALDYIANAVGHGQTKTQARARIGVGTKRFRSAVRSATNRWRTLTESGAGTSPEARFLRDILHALGN